MNIASLCMTPAQIAYTTRLGGLGTVKAERLPVKPSLADLGKRMACLLGGYKARMSLYPPPPDLLLMRRLGVPATGKQVAEMVRQHQTQGVIVAYLVAEQIRFAEIDVELINLFATGRRDEHATTVRHCATSRIQCVTPGARVPANDDEGHAWHLRQMGLVAHGLAEPVAEYQTDAVEQSMVFA